MWSQIKKNFKESDKKIMLVVGACLLLILLIGATYAYFVINNQNNATSSSIKGNFATNGGVTLVSNTSNLYLNLDGVLMNQSKVGTKYYATTDSKGTPITNGTLGNGIYTLGTASVESGTTKYNCTYKYKITATLNNPINDGSDEDIKLKFTGSSIANGSREYTLKELISEGTKGIELTGTFENLATGNNQTITIESTVLNINKTQDDFAGNRYSISIEPLPGSEGFSCEVATEVVKASNIRVIIEDYNSFGLFEDNIVKNVYPPMKGAPSRNQINVLQDKTSPVTALEQSGYTIELQLYGALLTSIEGVKGYYYDYNNVNFWFLFVERSNGTIFETVYESDSVYVDVVTKPEDFVDFVGNFELKDNDIVYFVFCHPADASELNEAKLIELNTN